MSSTTYLPGCIVRDPTIVARLFVPFRGGGVAVKIDVFRAGGFSEVDALGWLLGSQIDEVAKCGGFLFVSLSKQINKFRFQYM